MPAKYYTRKRLDEARYFFGHLSLAKDDDEFYFNLSAFLNAWKSILGIMMYDFNDFFVLGFSREDEIYPEEFAAAANERKNSQATEFIKWWYKKQGLLQNNTLWTKRNISLHRGYPPVSEYRLYVFGPSTVPYKKRIIYPSPGLPDSAVYRTPGPLPPMEGPISNSTIDPDNYFFTELPDKPAIQYCSEALRLIEGIVEEAEKKFSLTFTH